MERKMCDECQILPSIKNLIQTIKNISDHMMIWGCMSFNELGEMAVIEGNVNTKQYY